MVYYPATSSLRSCFPVSGFYLNSKIVQTVCKRGLIAACPCHRGPHHQSQTEELEGCSVHISVNAKARALLHGHIKVTPALSLKDNKLHNTAG